MHVFDDLLNLVLRKLMIEIGVRQAAGRPMLADE